MDIYSVEMKWTYNLKMGASRSQQASLFHWYQSEHSQAWGKNTQHFINIYLAQILGWHNAAVLMKYAHLRNNQITIIMIQGSLFEEINTKIAIMSLIKTHSIS